MNEQRPQIVAVAGGSGAGKTWLVRRLSEVLGDAACHLSLDDFYRDRSHLPLARRARLNFDVPGAIDWDAAERVLRDCRDARITTLPSYDFATYQRRPQVRRWEPRPIVFVEGLWVLRPPALRTLLDLKIYVDAPAAVRCARRVARDVEERGYSVPCIEERLHSAVLPMHTRYVEPQKRVADIVLTQPYGEAGLEALARGVWTCIEAAGLDRRVARDGFVSDLFTALLRHEYAS